MSEDAMADEHEVERRRVEMVAGWEADHAMRVADGVRRGAEQKERDERFARQERDRQAGLVECDTFCGAKDEPETDAEYRAAYEHWKRHGLLHGCSHGG